VPSGSPWGVILGQFSDFFVICVSKVAVGFQTRFLGGFEVEK